MQCDLTADAPRQALVERQHGSLDDLGSSHRRGTYGEFDAMARRKYSEELRVEFLRLASERLPVATRVVLTARTVDINYTANLRHAPAHAGSASCW